MSISLRAVLTSLAISSLYGSFIYACPDVSRDLGLDFWNFSDCEEELRRCKQMEKELQVSSERVMRRLSLKFMIAEDLVEQRITLKEATSKFIALNRMDPELMSTTCSLYPSASEEESVARQVISFVRNNQQSESSRSTETLKHLEQELQQLGRASAALSN